MIFNDAFALAVDLRNKNPLLSAALYGDGGVVVFGDERLLISGCCDALKPLGKLITNAGWWAGKYTAGTPVRVAGGSDFGALVAKAMATVGHYLAGLSASHWRDMLCHACDRRKHCCR